MNNPWLEISHSDYEKHMTEVGQAQVLNKLTKYCLDKYKPESFALLGCATGNGLEHINSEITGSVYAIDINPDYLRRTREKFDKKIKHLQTLNIDIRKDALTISNVDLIFVGLLLEYVEPLDALEKIIQCLNQNGILLIVIQENKQTSFVSKTKYKSLEKLGEVSQDVNESEIHKFIHSENLELIKRERRELTKNKSFISLEYRVKS